MAIERMAIGLTFEEYVELKLMPPKHAILGSSTSGSKSSGILLRILPPTGNRESDGRGARQRGSRRNERGT
jgi:hypothetical protein